MTQKICCFYQKQAGDSSHRRESERGKKEHNRRDILIIDLIVWIILLKAIEFTKFDASGNGNKFAIFTKKKQHSIVFLQELAMKIVRYCFEFLLESFQIDFSFC